MNEPTAKKAKWICFIVLIILTGINFYGRTRFLGTPNTTVFDETYYVKYSLSYCCSKLYYSDLHSPMPKLIYGIPGFFSEYKGDYPFDVKDKPAPPFDDYKLPIRAMRLIAIFVSLSLPILLFLFLRSAGGTYAVSLLPAIWLSLENATVLHSSFVLLDQFLLLGIFGTLLFYRYALKAEKTGWQISHALISGVFLALALGTKLTGICAAAAIGLDLTRNFITTKESRSKYLRILLWGSFSAIFVYLAAWVIHEVLIFGDYYRTKKVGWIFLMADRIVWLHMSMMRGHLSLGGSDGIGSRWWQWPLGYKPLLFWQDAAKTMYFFPNYLVWTGSVMLALFHALSRGYTYISDFKLANNTKQISGWLLLITAVLVNFLPNIFISRVLYLYHFLPALTGLLLLNAMCLQRFGVISCLKTRKEKAVYAALILIPLVGFVLTLPFSGGITGEWAASLKNHMDQFIKWR